MVTISIACGRQSRAADQVADDDAIQAADRHADEGDDQRVLDSRQALGEDHVVVGQRERVIGAERTHQRGIAAAHRDRE